MVNGKGWASFVSPTFSGDRGGAAVVRVGQAIFGKRPLPDGHYWPELG